ncbi:hypothetical protein H9P43_000846 [Blastocladiella emersonii ATCC 22665]|nr:hypothetical protein H9P43_000846 [Blastocladiella emersonii ATCC 22665]
MSATPGRDPRGTGGGSGGLPADLAQDLPEVTLDSVAFALASRFAGNEWAAHVGPGGSALASVSAPSLPVLQSSVATSAIRDAWKDAFRRTYEGNTRDALPLPVGSSAAAKPAESATAPPTLSPHVFSIVNDTLMEARRAGKSQSIVFRGKDADTQTGLALSHLLDIARLDKKNDKFQRRVHAGRTLIQFLGQTATTSTSSAAPGQVTLTRTPRYAEFMELLLDAESSSHRACGFRFNPLNFDSRHVFAPEAGSPTFLAFRYLLTGLDLETRTSLLLPNGFTAKACAAVVAGDAPTRPDEASEFAAFTAAMDTLNISKRQRDAVCRTLAAILHIGQLQFGEGGDRHGANKHDAMGSSAFVVNTDALDAAAGLLGVSPQMLESSLTSEIRLIGPDRVSVFLNAEQALRRASHVAAHVYHVVFLAMVNVINRKLSPDRGDEAAAKDKPEKTDKADKRKSEKLGGDKTQTPTIAIHLMNVPLAVTEADTVHSLINNYVVECIERYLQHALFEERIETMRQSGYTGLNQTAYISNADVFSLLDDRKWGLVPLLNAATNSQSRPLVAGAPSEDSEYTWLANACTRHQALSREHHRLSRITQLSPTTSTVQHTFGLATYRVDNLVRENCALLSEDVVTLFRGSAISSLRDMFRDEIVSQIAATTAAAAAKKRAKSKRKSDIPDAPATAASLVTGRLVQILASLAGSTPRVVFCLQHHPQPTSTACDAKFLQAQMAELNIVPLCEQLRQPLLDLTIQMAADEFTARYRPLTHVNGVPVPGALNLDAYQFLAAAGLVPGRDCHMSSGSLLIPMRTWQRLEGALRRCEREKKAAIASAKHARRGSAAMSDYADSEAGDSDVDSIMDGSVDDNESVFRQSTDLGSNARLLLGDKPAAAGAVAPAPTGKDADKKGKKPAVEEIPVSGQRRRWVAYTWLLTWWIPSIFLKWCGGMTRPDIQMAWREKVATCITILFFCAAQLFIIIGLGPIICPKQNIYNLEELYFKTSSDKAFVGIYGAVYKLEDFVAFGSYHPASLLFTYAGLDVTAGFPRTPAHYCQYAAEQLPNFPAFYDTAKTIANGTLIQVRHAQFYNQDRYAAEVSIDRRLKGMAVANVGFSYGEVAGMSSSSLERPRKMFIINDVVYDIQPYRDVLADDPKLDFLPPSILDYLVANAGKDLTSDKKWMSVWNGDAKLRTCFRNLMAVGVVDYRTSARCQVTNYVLLGFSCILVAVIFVKFLAALQLGSRPAPEELDKFVILQVPCYTEDEQSLRKTIDSLAVTRYDDKRKLLFIVCDGNIIGAGNDRPTPRIVLDIFGVDPEYDPEALSFQSLGDGIKQHNMGKIYSGLYDVDGHLVPYIVVVKVGRPSETSKPGNRGKRDSQMILMRFMNKVYLDQPMSPLELEMYHQINNVIGVNPMFYELCLMVDADTEIYKDSLTRLVATMVHDTTVMGCCGETRVANEKDTWTTMIQVYEYWISHHMAKAFESLFGTVTCLPGCFSMYRLRTPNKNTPVLCATPIIKEYGNVHVDTLHMKNLLHLGEDRYLTTLMLKYHPNMRTVFTADAICETVAPDRWNILLSQRRRWINSTIHNLVELLDIDELCGCCLFSMRAVVFLDLISTFLQPAIVAYLGYLVYLIVDSMHNEEYGRFPLLSLILLAAMYGVQAIIFLVKREWSHIVWMIIYLISIPIFSFAIPVYSFWHGDDLSWGQTRLVLGENGNKQVIHAEGEEFDPSMIPLKKWADYEQELLELEAKQSDDNDNVSVISDLSFNSRGGKAMSAYGGYGAVGGAYGGGMVQIPISPATGVRPQSMPIMSPIITSGQLAPGVPMSPSITTGFAASPMSATVQNRRSFQPQQSLSQVIASNGRPASMFVPCSAMPGTPLSASLASPALSPSDAVLFTAVQEILARSDLMTITKKQVREELSQMFGGVDLRARRDQINRMIAEILSTMQ